MLVMYSVKQSCLDFFLKQSYLHTNLLHIRQLNISIAKPCSTYKQNFTVDSCKDVNRRVYSSHSHTYFSVNCDFSKRCSSSHFNRYLTSLSHVDNVLGGSTRRDGIHAKQLHHASENSPTGYRLKSTASCFGASALPVVNASGSDELPTSAGATNNTETPPPPSSVTYSDVGSSSSGGDISGGSIGSSSVVASGQGDATTIPDAVGAGSSLVGGNNITDVAGNVAVTSDMYGWVASYIHFLQSISESAPVAKVVLCLRELHDYTGLPWWFFIILTTVMLRTAITFPVAVFQHYISAKVHLLHVEMKPLMEQLTLENHAAAREHRWDEATAKRQFVISSRRVWRGLVERDNCHPGKTVVLALVQIPVWVMGSVALRNMAAARPVADTAAVQTYYQLCEQGLLWFPNLTVPDPTLLLPLAMVLVNLVITEVHALQRLEETNSFQIKAMTNLFRGVIIITFPITVFMPSCVVLYWVTSGSCALLQTLSLLHPSARRVCRIPVTPLTHDAPYARMLHLLEDKFRRTSLLKLPAVLKVAEKSKKKIRPNLTAVKLKTDSKRS